MLYFFSQALLQQEYTQFLLQTNQEVNTGPLVDSHEIKGFL